MHMGNQIILGKSCPHDLYDFLKKEKNTESGQKGTDRGKRFGPRYDSTKIWELMDCMCYQCVCVCVSVCVSPFITYLSAMD